MNYNKVIGQEATKARILDEVRRDHLPHALMLAGPRGAGKMALALSLARHLLCQSPTEEGACGVCPQCQMTRQWAHPDLIFLFPIIKKKGSSSVPLCEDYMEEWRRRLARSPYFTIDDWLADMQAENQQATYYAAESDALLARLALKPNQGGRRVVVLWLPERMNQETANKLLKIIEEPPVGTHFVLVSERPDAVLGTILSRTQRINVPPLPEDVIARALGGGDDAAAIAHTAQGSYTEALRRRTAQGEEELALELFMTLMRKSYTRDIKAMRAWSEAVAQLGRERQKNFLAYCQRMIRENFIYNFRRHDRLNYETPAEAQFSTRFARFIHERNVIPITDELALAERDIEQNVNAKMVFFTLALRMIVLLLKK